MAIQELQSIEIEHVSGAGLLGALLYPLGIDAQNGLIGGGGGTLGLGGLLRGLLTGVPLLGPLLINLEAAL